jgi:PAS domain-containing protein
VLTLTVTKPKDILSLVVFLVVAVLTSELMSRVRNQADAARRREARTAALYAFGREIGAAAAVDDVARIVVEHVAQLFAAPAALFLPEAGRLVLRAVHPPGTELSEAERATATWVWEHDQPAGRGTDTLPGGEWFHVPLGTVRGAVSVVALRVDSPSAVPPLDQRQLLEALAGQAAVAIERTRVDLVEAVIESIEDGLVVLDPKGVVVHVNEVACAILGFDRDEAVGRRFEDLGTSHPHYLRLRSAVRDFLAEAGAGARGGRDGGSSSAGATTSTCSARRRSARSTGRSRVSSSSSRTSRTCAIRRPAASSSWRRCRTSSGRRSRRSAWRSSSSGASRRRRPGRRETC